MYPVVFLGIIMAGGRFSGANPNYTADELRHHFKVSATRFVLSDRRSLAEIHVASQGLFDAKNVMTWDRWDTLGITSQPSLNSSTADNNHDASLSLDKMVAFDDKSRAQETIAALMSTSGTTGLPKMAVRSHLSWVTENLAIQDSTTKPYQINRLLFTPFFHGFTAPLALIDALRSGHKTYTMSRFDLKKCLDYVERYRITELAAPPPVLLAFMQLSEQEREVLKSIRLVWSGGAPMSASMQNRAREMFHAEARIVQVYGMTEAGWITTFKYPEGDATGSVGRLLPTYEAK
jgi:acyl-CoA synthetase (AMP-forming)/AMP-acid ligase II